MSFLRYPKYKHSGVEWLGEVPEHWLTSKLGYESWVRARLGWKGLKADEYVDSGIAFLATPNIKGRRIDFRDVNFISEDRYEESPEIKLRVRDVLISKDGSLGVVNIVRELPHPATVNSSIAVITAGERLDERFLCYFLQSVYITNTIERMKGGMGVPHLFQDDLSRFDLLLPPPEEQRQIADVLDIETARTDVLVDEQQRLIALLKEKRHAVISHAVTKGLNPDARMKPSGVEWLGDVPTHWRVERMKWVARMESGHTPDKKVAAYWENCEIPWVSLNDTGYLKDNEYISETAYNVNELGIANSSARLLPPGAVVFSRDATIGRCAITTRPMAVSQHFIAWICGESILPEYLLFRLRSMTQELKRLTAGATLRTIGMPDVKTLMTPVPPIEEQRAIVKYISESTAALDDLIEGVERSITLLQERRTALISFAVTGKIDVRGFASAKAAAA